MNGRYHRGHLANGGLRRTGAGTRSGRRLLLIAPALLRRDRRRVLRNAFARNRYQTPSISSQWIVPADSARLWIETINFSASRRKQTVAIQHGIHEVSPFQRGHPKLFARRRVERDH
jgi:hypothetical protein